MSKSREVRHLVMRRAASIEQAMRAAGQETSAEVLDAHLRMARTLAREILKVLDGHLGATAPWDMREMSPASPRPSLLAPVAKPAPPENRPRTAPPVPAVCATCEHWYPDGVRDLAEHGTCRKPAFVSRVHYGRRPWPSVDREDNCVDWAPAPRAGA